ncbi:facilitated trehalose transporter Tret1-2 homolog [Prorops nasuta]|uniref:facilitated trehalose transporter Tret1-2 homolog n=1 Tax=Prorops nasuta TaxID=863751 RepID=UPI0034CD73C1
MSEATNSMDNNKVVALRPEELKEQEKKGIIYQISICLLVCFVVLGPSMGFGYSAIAIPPLTSLKTDDLRLTLSQANWFATASALGIPFGCVVSSFVMSRGRKLSLLAISGISLIGWLTIHFTSNYEQILAGRVISGVATGMASVPATVYIAEVSGPKWRSTMVTWTSVSIAVGILLVYVFGYFIQENWRTVALICSLFPVVSIVLTLTLIPESPMWLREKGRVDEAITVLKRFRGVPKDQLASPGLLQELQSRHQNRKKQNLWRHLTKRTSLVPFGITLSYFLFQQFSGIFVVIYYAVNITQEAGLKMDAYMGAVLIGLTRLFGSLLVAFVSRKFGRRLPTVVSGAGMTFFMGALALYLYMIELGYEFNDGGVIPVICVLMYIFVSTLGFLVLPFAMVGELFPAKVKDVLSGTTTCIAYIFSSITVKTYPDMLALMGKHGVFLFYALVSLVGTIFLGIFLPETKGKTLDEIQDLFSKKKKTRNGFVEVLVDDGKIMPMKTCSVET